MSGTIGILNVGAGDTKLTFDKSNPAECIRSARIVADMLRRGYALLVEVERNGEKAFERVHAFDESICSYIIADFDPVAAAEADASDAQSPDLEASSHEEESQQEAATPTQGKRGRGRPSKTRAVHASEARGVAVARSAGG